MCTADHKSTAHPTVKLKTHRVMRTGNNKPTRKIIIVLEEKDLSDKSVSSIEEIDDIFNQPNTASSI